MRYLILIPIFLVPLFAAEDAEGCQDSKILPRLKGCAIESCNRKSFDSASILTGVKDGAEVNKDVEGSVEELQFLCPSDVSGLQIARNVANALKQAGFQLVFNAKDHYQEHAVSGRKGNTWLSVRTNSESRYNLTTVVEKAMEQELAIEWKGEMEKTGKVAVYGIEFETGSANLLPESETVLQQVASWLTSQPDLRLRIVGHTDNTGPANLHQKLSAARAASVVKWLSSNGVEANRLVASGVGASQPVADNATEEGRKKNRRVELIRAN